MIKANGDWYKGQWIGNLPSGEGEAEIGGLKFTGVWDNGCLQSGEQQAAWGRAKQECR